MRFRFLGLLLAGILLGLVVAVGIALAASPAFGQELPPNIKGATPYPDNAVCSGWQMFESGEYDRRVQDPTLAGNLASVRDRLRTLCGQSPDEEAIRSGGAVGWLTMVDNVFDTLTMSLYDRFGKPVSAKERVALQQLLQTTAILQRDFELMRISAYQAVRTRTETVVKTVEVPARCPEVVRAPDPPPDPVDECDRQLRQATRRWYGMATDILGPYGETGRANDAFQVVVQVRREISALPSDADVLPSAVSWHQRLERAANNPANVKRDGSMWDFFQLSASERSRIEDLAADIHSQLRLCRRY